MIGEASVYAVKRMDPEAQQSLGLRVLIMRRWPRGIARQMVNVWLPDAGPSVDLLNAYNGGFVKWDEFEARYHQEQESLTCCRMVTYAGKSISSDAWMPLSPMQLLRDLERQHGTVTVMCRERAGEHCHRHIVVQSAKEKSMQACESCKRPYSLAVDTYCVPVQTEYGMLCHQCQAANAKDMQNYGYATHVSDEIKRQRGEANKKQFAEMLKEVL